MADLPIVRHNPLTGQEVIFAPSRRDRPHVHSAAPCPFCPGNEAMLGGILWQREENGAWLSRVTINLYPIVSPPAGHHEVIIETPRHSLAVTEMTAETWSGILSVYSARICDLSPQWRHLSLFRNGGRRAGSSLTHPHSQLIALARVPGQIGSRRRRLRDAYKQTGYCVLCGAIGGRGDLDERIVARSDAYVAFVPELAEVPFEVWVVPAAHSSQFSFADENDRWALAGILGEVFHKMGAVLGDFDHNMMLIDAAGDARPYLHWYWRIRPQTETAGGFELSTGMAVNPSLPDADAAKLRATGGPRPDAVRLKT